MDTEYILDCAFEYGELTSVEHAVLSSSRGGYSSVREAIDRNMAMPEHFLPNTARSFMDHATVKERYFFALSGMAGLEYALNSFAGRVSHLVQAKSQFDLLGGEPLVRDLYPELRLVGNDRLVAQESDVGEGLVRMMAERMFESHVHRWNEDLALMREAAGWYLQDGGLEFRQMLNADKPWCLQAPDAPLAVREAAQAHQRRMKRLAQSRRTNVSRAKSAIKKATKLFQNLGKEKSLQMFVSGNEVILSHPDSRLKFVLKPLGVQGWLIDRTQVGRAHTPYELCLFTKDDVYLSKLCVYFEATPVLDQVLALSLFIEAGDELKILERANWYAASDWGPEKSEAVLTQYPQLASRIPRPLKEHETQRTIAQTLERMDTEFMRRERHWKPFKGRVEQWVYTWMEPARNAAQSLVTDIGAVRTELQRVENQTREFLRLELELQAST